MNWIIRKTEILPHFWISNTPKNNSYLHSKQIKNIIFLSNQDEFIKNYHHEQIRIPLKDLNDNIKQRNIIIYQHLYDVTHYIHEQINNKVKLFEIAITKGIMYCTTSSQAKQHHWCSGNITAFQAVALSSILGWCSSTLRFVMQNPRGVEKVWKIKQERTPWGSNPKKANLTKLAPQNAMTNTENNPAKNNKLAGKPRR